MQWNGPWSERSWEWDSLSDRDKELLSVRVRNEGEFWMSFDDFAKQFSHLDLVSREDISASKSSIRRLVITEKAPTRAFSWLKAATTAFTFTTLLRHYAKRALTPR